MIYSLVVNLEAQNDAEITTYLGHHGLGLFLSLIRQVDEPLAKRLHSTDGLKPFTVSPLQGKFRQRKGDLHIAKGSVWWLRFTALEEIVFARLMESFLKGNSTLRLEQAHFRVADVITHPQGSPWAGFNGFDEILESASSERKISLQFNSPTVFRSGGRRNITFPSPELIFGSLLMKWNAFSQTNIDRNIINALENDVLVSRYKLETKMLEFESYSELGFAGTCTYLVKDSVPGAMVRDINALADFSFYCGTGAKTTMGMGQTRRLKNVSALSGRAGS